MDLPELFKEFLSSSPQGASSLTVKNYLADVKQFIRWYESFFNRSFTPDEITFQTISSYKNSLTGPPARGAGLSASSIDRHISSLRKFFKFLKLEGHVSQNPFEENAKSQKPVLDPWRLKDFKNFLYVYNSSHLTIKNYIIDIRQFLSWVEEVSKSTEDWIVEKKTVFELITPALVQEYKQRLIDQTAFSPASINRKLSSIRRFMAWAETEGLLRQQAEISNLKSQISNPKEPTVNRQSSIVNRQSYSSFPPLRLVQKIGRGVGVAFDEVFIIPIVAVLGKLQHLSWLSSGKPIFTASKLPPLTALQRGKIGLGIKNLPKSFYAPAFISVKHFPLRRKLWHHARYTRPQWYKTYRTSSVSGYLNFTALVIFIAAVVLTLYNAFFQKPTQNQQVLAAVPTAPLRILSFQGKLTDIQDIPITSPTALRFTLYSDDDASASARLWEERRVVAPDSDGVFSVLLGSNTTGGTAALCNGNSAPNSPTGSCGIMSTLFSENAALWLGVTVGSTAELTPRQQIATVAYASNAETLQGLIPITNSTSQTNVVLALNSSGNLSIGGSATPTFEASGGTFTLKGQGVVISTTSNGNITLAPNGGGLIDLQRPIRNSTNNNNISSAQGAVEVDDLFAVLATSSAQSAVTIEQQSTGPLISASVSGTAKFTVDNSGGIFGAGNLDIDGTSNDIAGTLNLSGNTLTSGSNLTVNATSGYVRIGDTATPGSANGDDDVFIEGDLEIDGVFYADGTIDTTFSNDGGIVYANSSGVLAQTGAGTALQCLVGGATPSFGACPTGTGDAFWNQSGGALFPSNSTVDFFVGGQATSSAKFAVLNIAAGTPTASISANSGNNALYFTGDGTIGTTNRQTLTLGTSTTGNIELNSGADMILFSDNLVITGTISDNNSDVYITDNFNPSTDATYDLGDTTTSWRNLYLTGTLCFDDTDCATSWGPFTNFWQQTSGVLFPNNSTVDFFIGGQATTSAKFAVLNINSGTPTASISAGSAGGAYLNATGTLQTTAGQTLTLGGSTTGNIVIDSGSSSITLSDNTSLSGNLSITGTISDSDSNLILDDTVDIGSATTGINVTTTGVISDSDGNVVIGDTVDLGSNTTGINITTTGVISDSDGNISLNDNTDVTGNITLTGTLSDSDSDLSIADHLNPSTDATYNLGSTTLSWQDIYLTGQVCFDDTDCFDSTSSSVGIWSTSNSAFYPKGPYTGVVDLLLGSTATTSAKFGFLNVNSGTPTASISANSGDNATFLTGTGNLATTNNQTLTIGGTTTGNITINAGADTIALSDNTTIAGTLILTGTISDSDSNLILDDTVDIGSATTGIRVSTTGDISDIDGDIAISDNTGITGNLDVSGTLTSGTADIFQVAATGAISTLTDETINGIDISSGAVSDITTLSASSTITFSTFISDGGIIYTTGTGGQLAQVTAGTASQCLLGGTTPVFGSCATGTADVFWGQGSGALFTNNSTVDLLVGGQATASAKFAVLNIAAGVPTASISANSGSNATTLTGTGILATTNGQTLTIGNSTTGNIVINAGADTITLSDNTALTGTFTLTGAISDSDSNLSLNDNTDITGNLDASGTLTSGTADAFTVTATGVISTITNETINGIDINAGAVSDVTTLSLSGAITDSDSDLYITDNLNPTTDATYDLGDTTTSWRNLYVTGNICFDDTDCFDSTSASVGLWSTSNSAFYPKGPYTGVVDLLLGSTATASAKIGLLNINSGTPTASISANSGNIATYLTGLGNLATTNGQTLTVGGSTTGNVVVDSGAGVISFSDTISGGAIGIDFTEFDVSATNGSVTINDGGDAGYVSVEGTILDQNSLDFAGGGTLTTNGSNSLTLTPGGVLNLNSTGDMTLDSSTDIILDADGADVILKDAGTEFARLTNSSTDLIIDPAGGGVKIGTGTPGNVDLAGDDLYVTQDLEVDGTIYGNVTGSLTGTASDLSCTGCVDLTTEVSGVLPTANGGTNKALSVSNGGIVWSDTDSLEILAGNANSGLALVSGGAGTPSWFAPTAGSVIFAGTNGALAQDNASLFFDDTLNKLGVGVASLTNFGKFNVQGKVTGKALVIFDETGDQNIFTASASGATKFSIGRTAGALIFEGATADLITTTLTPVDPTSSSKSINIPNASGTVAVSASSPITLSALGDIGCTTCLSTSTSLFTLTGSDAGTDQTISSGDTLTIAAGTGIDTTPSATDTLTVAFDSTEIGTTTWGSGSGITWTFDAGATDPTLAFASAQITAGATTVVLSGTTTLTASSLTTLTSAATLGISATTLNLGGGSAATIGTVSDDNLTITPNGTGELTLTSDFDTPVNVGASTNTPAVLSVSGGIANNAAFNVNNVNNGNLIVASASGTTKFIVANGGDVSTAGILQAGGTTVAAYNRLGTATAGGANIGANNDLLISDALEVDGVIYADGGLVGNVTGTASDLSCSNCVALTTETSGDYVGTITGSGTITSTGATSGEGIAHTLSVTADSIGDTQLAFNTGQHLTTASSPTLAGLTLSGDLAVNGATSADITSTTTTASVFDSTVTTLNIGGAATTWDIGASTGTGTINNATLAITGNLDANGSTNDIAGTLNLSGNTLASSADLTIDPTGGGVKVGTGTPGSVDLAGDDLYVTQDLEVDGVIYGNVTGNITGTASDLSCTGCVDSTDIANDTIDWIDIANSMTLDAATDINLGAFALTVDMDSTGDFSIRDGTTDILAFTDSGAITASPTSGQSFTLTLGGAGDLIVNTNDLYVDTSVGNVGIGTATPGVTNVATGVNTSTQLDVQGSGGTFTAMKDLLRIVNTDAAATNNTANISLFARRAGNLDTPVASISAILSNTGATTYTGELAFSTAGTAAVPTERMRIDGSGNVGIGTTTPANILHIVENSGVLRVGADIGATYMGISLNGSAPTTSGYNILGSSADSNLRINRPTGGYIGFRENNVDQMVILTGGNVGIGTTGPLGELHLSSTASTQFFMSDSNAAVDGKNWDMLADETTLVYRLVNDANSAATNYITVERSGTTVTDVSFPNGNVGIGTTAPYDLLDITKATSGGVGGRVLVTNNNADVLNNAADIAFKVSSSYTAGYYSSRIASLMPNWPTNNYGALAFYNFNGGTTSGTELMRIDSTGNVGIGTTGPRAALDVTGSASLSANLSLRGAATAHTFNILDNGTLNIQRSPGGDAGLATALFVQNNGNVGIGTAAPGANTNATGPIVDTTGAFVSTRSLNQNLPRFIFYDDKSNASYVSYDSDAQTRFKSTSNWLWQSVGTGANIYTTGTTRMTLDTSGNITNTGTLTVQGTGNSSIAGNVGIGTTSPQRNLHINGTAAALFTNATTGVTASDGFQIIQSGLTTYLEQQEAASLILRTSAADRMTIDSAGNVGIGTTSPDTLLDVEKSHTDHTTSFMRLTNSSSTGQTPLDFYINGTMRGKYRVDYLGNVNLVANGGGFEFFTGGDSGTGTSKMTILSGGNVGIGTTAPTANLEVAGSGGVFGTNDKKLFSLYNSDATATNNVAGIQFSANRTGAIQTPTASISAILTNNGATTYTGALAFSTAGTAAIPTERMRIDGSGNVGIGTTNPQGLLDLTSTGIQHLYFTKTAATANTGYIKNDGSMHYNSGTGTGVNYYESNDQFFLSQNTATQYGRLNGTGLTVGTCAPSVGFEVCGSGAATSPYSVLNGLRISGGDTTNTIWNAGRNIVISADTGHLISLSQTSTPATGLTVNTTNGNVGIGTTGPDRALVVTGTMVTDVDSKSQVQILSSAAYNASPVGGLSFGVKYNAGGSVAYGTSIQGYKENATDGNFAQGLRFTTQANSVSPATRMTIDSAGNVGIGTTNPTGKLDVKGGASDTTDIFHIYNSNYVFGTSGSALSVGMGAATGDTYTAISAGKTGWTAWSDLVLQSGGGNVGIGTTGPESLLHVSAGSAGAVTSSTTTGITIEDDADTQLQFLNPAANTGNIFFGDVDDADRAIFGYAHSTDEFRFMNAGGASSLMVIEQGGNVGIGTTGPGYKLDVVGEIKSRLSTGDATGIVAGNAGSQLPYVKFTASDDSARFKLQMNGLNTSAERLSIYAGPLNGTATTETMVIGGNGNVGIGTTAPAYELDVNGFTNTKSLYKVSDEGTVLAMNFDANDLVGTAGSEAVLDSSGRNNHGTNSGAAYTATGGFNSGGALTFGGADDSVTIANSSLFDFGTGDFAVSTWVKPSSVTSLNTIAEIGLYTAGILIRPTGGNLEVYLQGVGYTTQFPFSMVAGNWYQVVVTRVSGSLKVYINGTQSGSSVASTDNIAVNSVGYIGRSAHTTAQNFLGNIDDFRIFNRSLSADEVKTLYLQRAESVNSYVAQKDVYVTNASNVGIGTTSPGGYGDGGSPKILEVNGGAGYGLELLTSSATANGSTLGVISFGTSGASTTKRGGIITSTLRGTATTNAIASMEFYTTNDAGTLAERVRIDQNGNVGIGDTSPDALLDLDAATTTTAAFGLTDTGVHTGTGTSSITQITADSATTGDILTISATGLTTGSGLVLTGATTGATDALFKISGDVGDVNNLGTIFAGLISSTATFDSADTGVNLFLNTTNSHTGNGDTGYGIYSKYANATTLSSNDYGIYTLVNNTGVINTEEYTKTVYGSYIDARGTGGLSQIGLTTEVYGQYITTNASMTGGVTNQYGLYIDDGTSGTGGTSVKYGLYVEAPTGADNNYGANLGGRILFSSTLGTGTGGNYLCINTTTFEVLRGNGSACTASSARFKENINDLNYGLSDIMDLRPVTYNYKSEMNMGNGLQVGFIAEDVEKIIPELVSYDQDGLPSGVNYPQMTSLLAKGIQEQQLEIVGNQNKILDLETDLSLTTSGNLSIVQNDPGSYSVAKVNGASVTRVGAFAELVSAKIRAGVISAREISSTSLTSLTANIGTLTADTISAAMGQFNNATIGALAVASDSVTIAGETLHDYIARIVDDRLASQGDALRGYEADRIATNIISPLSDTPDAKIAVKLNDNEGKSKFEIRDASDSAVVSIDSLGNATFSGQLTSDKLTTKNVRSEGLEVSSDASVSGTLRAKRIIADQIEGLSANAASVSANYITNNNYYTASQSGSFAFTEADGYVSVASFAAQLAQVGSLNAENAVFSQSLISYGTSSFYDIGIASQISVGAQLTISDTAINVLGDDLKLQPLKQGGIALVGGEVYIDPSGNMTVKGNATFAKDVEVRGRLSANIISPLQGRDLVVELGSTNQELGNRNSSFIIHNSSRSGVLAVDSQGNLTASGSATFGKLNLGLVAPALAVSDTEVIATGSAGVAFIKPYQTEVTVINSLVTENSLVYITPVGSTSGNLYLLRQTGNNPENGIEGSFTVGISQPGIQNLNFNYLIVN